MRKKAGKYYADWRDEHGRRHMKACASKEAAIRLSRKMRREVAAKKAQSSGMFAPSPKRGARKRPTTNPIAASRKSSRSSRATSNRDNSTASS